MVKVIAESIDLFGAELENCFKCCAPTRYWHIQKDVPCCPDCAAVLTEADIPTKAEWIYG